MRVLLVSTYDLGRQPFGLSSPAAWLRREGVEVMTADVSRKRLDDDTIASASLVGFYLPMHTATRLAGPLISRVRRLNPEAHLCAFGIYAPINADWLRDRGVRTILDGEFEGALVALVRQLAGGETPEESPPQQASIARLAFIPPDRSGLPPLTQYASLMMPDGSQRAVGSTEASRGCKHLCRHCPIVPVYQGQFRIVPPEVVLADVRGQIAAGARHITFGDPDFLNGPTHARRIVEGLAAEHPGVTYDVTIKIEHLLRHDEMLPVLRDTGCLFVTSAVESVDDRILEMLAKGHTRADFMRVAGRCRELGLTLSPTFVPFTPWTTLDGYVDLLDTIERLDLVEHVAPIQLAIRLLVTAGSPLLELADIRDAVQPFDASSLTWPWRHPDARVDALQERVMQEVGTSVRRSRAQTFEAVAAHACAALGHAPRGDARPARDRATVPYLNEPWYC